MRKVLIIPDTHFPFHKQDCLTWIYKVTKEKQPDILIQIGDLFDWYSASRFARSHNILTPEEEYDEGRRGAEAMWKNLKAAAPRAACLQILGNHDVRPNKRVLDACPELESLLDMESPFRFKGVKTIMDPTEEVEIDGVVYTHGTFLRSGDHCRHYQQNVVHGHTHRGSVFFARNKNSVIWELDCGFASDESQVPLRYGATRRTGWTLGCGWVDSEGPRFLPAPPPKK